MVEKLFARLKFQKELQNYATTDDRQDKNKLPHDLRSRGHKITL